MGDSKNAEKYFKEALAKDDQKNPSISTEIFITYANMLLDQNPLRSIDMSKKALQIAERQKLDKKLYNIYFNLSGANFTLGNITKATEMMDKAIENAIKNNKSLTQFYLGLAQIKEAENKNDESRQFYLKAIDEAQKEKDLYMEMQSLTYLKNFYKKGGHNAELISVIERENLIKDSIRSTKLAIATQEMDYRYQTEKKEIQIAELTRSNRLKTFLSVAALIAVLAVLTLFINRRKHIRLKEAYFKDREQILEQNAKIAEQATYLEKEAKEKAQLSQRLQEEENLKLHLEMENTNRELVANSLYIREKNKLLENLQEKINAVIHKESSSNRKELHDISRELKKQIAFEDDWTKIKLHFEKVHPDFFNKLSANYPLLTQNDLKNCAYIRMKLNHKDIANLTGLDYNSVKMARYRIKKKLNLAQDDDLNSFIESI